MSKPRAVHTVESLLARTDEIGECRVWNGYYGNAGTPQVCHEGGMVSVRKLIVELEGKPINGKYFAVNCDTCGCIEPKHIVQRYPTVHYKAMAKKAHEGTAATYRKKRVTIARRSRPDTKLDLEKVREIRASEESSPILAEKYGVSRSLISRIRSGKQWRDEANPFAGLFTGLASNDSRGRRAA